MYGFAGKNYLSHEFKSSIVGEKQNADLVALAKHSDHKKDKINPIAFVTVSDMSYESDRWMYTRRATPHFVTRELSAVEDTSVAI